MLFWSRRSRFHKNFAFILIYSPSSRRGSHPALGGPGSAAMFWPCGWALPQEGGRLRKSTSVPAGCGVQKHRREFPQQVWRCAHDVEQVLALHATAEVMTSHQRGGKIPAGNKRINRFLLWSGNIVSLRVPVRLPI